MYQTPQGERTLRGAERRLFVESLGMIVDFLSEGDYEAGITLFDCLQRNQKIAVLLGVSKGLLRDNVSPPPLTAISEATVAVVYQHMEEQIVGEIREETCHGPSNDTDFFGDELKGSRTSWRTLVADACRDIIPDARLPPPDDSNEENWLLLIDCLRDHVLWDEDWEMLEQQNSDPEQQRQLKEEMGIDEDYFVWVPPDSNDELAARMLTELQYLTPDGRSLGDFPN